MARNSGTIPARYGTACLRRNGADEPRCADESYRTVIGSPSLKLDAEFHPA
jgi:hypothetical protein